jgi:hypothetical protein
MQMVSVSFSSFMLVTFLHHLKLHFVLFFILFYLSTIYLPSAYICFDQKNPLSHSLGSTPMYLDRLVQEIQFFWK